MAADTPRPTGERLALLSANIDEQRNATITLRLDLTGDEGDAIRSVAVMLAEAVDLVDEVLAKRANVEGP